MRTCARSVPRYLIVVISSLLLLFAGRWGVRAYVGEITYDGLVDGADLAVIEAAFGQTDWSGDPAWNAEADLNEDDRVDVMDLAIAGRSHGSDRNLHQARRLANSTNTTNRLDACLDGLGRLHVVWSETDWRSVYYTRLDRYGNTLVDDVLVDQGSSTGVDLVAVGCDAEGTAHLIWDCGSDVCQARFDRWGYPILSKTLVDDRLFPAGADGSVGLDSQGRAHVLYQIEERMVYAMLTGEGEKAVSIEDPLIADIGVSRYRQLEVDGSDNVHLLWSEEEGEDRLFYARLGADADTSIPATVIGLPQWDGLVTSAHRPSLALDGQGNAFVLWNGGDPRQLYLDKIDRDGNELLDDYPIFPEWELGHYQDLAIGQDGRLHLLAPTAWGRSMARSAYGNFDNSAQPLYPMRWVLYGWRARDPHLLVDAQDDLHLFYKPEDVTADDPPCPPLVLCYQGTAFDPVAYDRTRPDLGVDAAHLDWAPVLARWGQSLTVTATVFNAGWVNAPATTAHFEVLASDETPLDLDAPLQAQVAVAALAPRQSQQVTATLSLPTTPPAGYETLEYARLEVRVDPVGAISETTEENNRLAAPLMIQPLPTRAGLFVMVKDVTPTSRGGDAVPLKTGDVHLTGPGISRSVEVEDYVTVLDGLPISATPVTYTVSWAAAAPQGAVGYRASAPIEIGIVRNAVDPYQVDYSPGNTALFETDTWGSLSGMLTDSDTDDPLPGATVRVQGQGLSLQVTTDGAGTFSPSTEPLLGKLPPGDYTIYASAAGYARLYDDVDVPSLAERAWAKTMDPTTNAYVRGSVINQFGRPVANAQLDACGVTGQSVSDGSFDLGEVPATCALLEVDKAGYATANEFLALSAGLEAYLPDITLSFDPLLDVVQDEGGMASWYQDESSADLLPDPPDDASWVEEQLFGTFSDKFWPSYRVQVWWGCYEFAVDAAYSGPEADRHLSQVQVRLVPKTFEAHRVSGSGTVKVNGRSIKVNLGVFQDSGVTTALWVVEARLVNADTGAVIKTVRANDGGIGSWIALEDTTRTYDFGGVTVPDWDATELWLYIKVGKNEGDEWTGSPILRGWHFDQQVLRL
ncbi:MAG: carboxypeptidase regulatory-like domain-containing protein, partial [Anaerolineae bacterium]|nr:carboxypeptidase regulatory-like domain-containing protein [Anaerolineae bacterium]